jgi:hypothetical protein
MVVDAVTVMLRDDVCTPIPVSEERERVFVGEHVWRALLDGAAVVYSR